ncbi:MAG: fatty acid desaturase [Cyanobacteria bacterium J06592_8]
MTHSISDPSSSRQSYPVNWISVAFFAIFHILALLALSSFSWSAIAVTLFLHWCFGSLGICLGYHRLLSHRSLQVPKWLEYILAISGALAVQGGPIIWVAAHRRHHAHTEDNELDPYSAGRGFWWSHMGWLFYKREQVFNYQVYRKYAPDLDRQVFYRWLNRCHLLLQIPLAILLYCLGGWSFVIYGIFVRTVLLWHCTWLINSATHIRGDRRFESADNSRNLWWAAIISYGEGWHNNHHAYPKVAKAGWKWWEIDSTWWVIRILQLLGLTRKVVLPPA